MAATVLKRFNTLTLASGTPVQVVSGSGGKHYYNIINLGAANLYIRGDQAPTGATDPAAFEIPATLTHMVSIFVPSGTTGLWLLADAGGKVSLYDQSA